MEKEHEAEIPTEQDEEVLKFKIPVRGESASSAPLNSTGILLPPELLKQRDRALGNLARQRGLVPPDIGVN